MKRERKVNLMKKGWSEEDIKKAESITESRHRNDKSRSLEHSHRLLFWGMLALLVVVNSLVAFILIPFLLTLTQIATSFFIFVIGFAIGLWFNMLVWDIDHLTKKHHLLAVLIIPIFAIMDLYAMVRISNALNDVFGITNIRGDPLTISAIYIIALLFPYLFTVFFKKKIKKY